MKIEKIKSRKIDLSNLDKILYPDEKITKREVIEYYKKITPYILPYLKNRPITIQRFPDGIKKEGFYQKNFLDYFPSWIKKIKIKLKKDGINIQPLCNDLAALMYFVNQAAIVFHIWLSKADKLEYPDRIIFDLDPSDEKKESFEKVARAAKKIKNLFEKIGAKPFVMATGSRGIHVVAPIKRSYPFEKVKIFAEGLAVYLTDRNHNLFTTEIRKEKRANKIFIDVQRNAYAQTSVAPYSLRAKRGAPIAVPLDWGEINKNFSPQKYNIKNIFRRLAFKKDPWRDFFSNAKDLKQIINNFKELKNKS